MNQMKLDWRQGILRLTIMGMEYCWLCALLFLLNDWVVDGLLAILWLLPLYPGAFIFNKLWRWRRFKIYVYAVNGLVLTLAIWLLVETQIPSGMELVQLLKSGTLLVGGSIALWWLGWRLADLRVTFTNLFVDFQFGLPILLSVFLIASLVGIQLTSSIPIVLAFFLFALVGMALAHTQDGVGWLTGSHQNFWAGLLLASIGLILSLGLLIGSVITPDFLQLVLIPFKWLWSMFWKGIEFLLGLFPASEPVELPPEMVAPEIPQMEPDGFKMWTIPASLRTWFRIGYAILVSGFLLLALWRISSQILGWLRRKLTPAEAEVESLPGALKADLLGLLKHIMLKLLKLRLLFRRQKKLEPISSGTASVRQIYHQFLRWAARSGWPRQLSQTPHEYLYTLEGLLPVAQQELRLITEQYVSARYSPLSPTEEELYQLRQSWHQLRKNRLKKPDSEHTY